MLLDQIEQLRDEAQAKINSAGSTPELEALEVEYLGRKGKVTLLLRGIGSLSAEERPGAGQQINQLKQLLSKAIETRKQQLSTAELNERLKKEAVDISLPGVSPLRGSIHPMMQMLQDIKKIFIGLGFEMAEGPEIELYKYNFEGLNYPKEHPAMDEQMSFYITDDMLLRTQTSAVQIRAMEGRKPPVRLVVPGGRCYRYDAVDASHMHTFHQIEGFMVDEGISFGDLKGTLEFFIHQLYGEDINMRFRPDFFPFVEPGAEMSMTCVVCRGKGCRVCQNSGWLEIGGSGMVHPNVLRYVGYDPEKYTGFAFGVGLERMTMLRYGIDDIRHFLDGDLRFLHQF